MSEHAFCRLPPGKDEFIAQPDGKLVGGVVSLRIETTKAKRVELDRRFVRPQTSFPNHYRRRCLRRSDRLRYDCKA